MGRARSIPIVVAKSGGRVRKVGAVSEESAIATGWSDGKNDLPEPCVLHGACSEVKFN